jgi:hypothetical protein
METDHRHHFKYKLEYFKLALQISILRYQGDEPPKKLLQQAHDMVQLASVSEHELKNL